MADPVPGSSRVRAASASAARRRDVSRAAREAREHELLDQLGSALVGERRRHVAGDRSNGRRGMRHGSAMAGGGDHLDVVELVADREDVGQRDAGPASHATATPLDARSQELKEARVADRHLGPAGEALPCRVKDLVRIGSSATEITFETGRWIAAARSCTGTARPPNHAE